MKIQSRKKNKIVPIALILLAVLLIGSALLYYLSSTSSQKKPAETASESESARQSDNNQSQDLRDNPDIKQQAPNTDSPSIPTTDESSNKQRVQLTASTNISNGVVYLRGGVNYPVQGGSCYASLTGPSGQSLRKDTTVLQNPASTDCKTISIPSSELAPGKWSFTLHYTSDNYEGTSDAVTLSI